MNISIVMTTYNGEKYIYEQLQSVVEQLKDGDELIISDDGSNDTTMDIIKKYSANKIRLINGPEKGVVMNFEQAFRMARNEVVLICDQDDIWVQNKLDIMRMYMHQHSDKKVFLHDAYVMHNNPGDSMETIFSKRKAKHGIWKNIIVSTYYGCCMAVNRQYLLSLLPFPNNILYDQYIGNCGEIDKVSEFVTDKLIYHREGCHNWSKKQNPVDRIKIRAVLLYGAIYHLKKRRNVY